MSQLSHILRRSRTQIFDDPLVILVEDRVLIEQS
jgi:hypothetical protein